MNILLYETQYFLNRISLIFMDSQLVIYGSNKQCFQIFKYYKIHPYFFDFVFSNHYFLIQLYSIRKQFNIQIYIPLILQILNLEQSIIHIQ
ncbi:unnamed protein product [Paramecium pentaurelia]|uniref:Uncharacterized protein n=1 Tax=Paramecium pentaurelia TaxID=43138 RepID=A0A8S1UDD2_9CILI|nr:unnamed protein product [Paramecium pentaurelia]